MISSQDQYNAAVFVQYLDEEFNKELDTIEEAVCNALLKFSPAATPQQINAYTDSICDTISSSNGDLYANWRDLLISEHAA